MKKNQVPWRACYAGHFCGNRWCAAVPETAACAAGCPTELPRYDKDMPNLLPIDLGAFGRRGERGGLTF